MSTIRGRYHRTSAGEASGYRSSGGELALGLIVRRTDLDGVPDRVLAPLEPAAVVDRDSRPVHEVGVEPRLAGAPAGAAVERDPLVGGDSRLAPVRCDLRVRAHRVVHVPVVLHVIGVGTAVAPHVARDPA